MPELKASSGTSAIRPHRRRAADELRRMHGLQVACTHCATAAPHIRPAREREAGAGGGRGRARRCDDAVHVRICRKATGMGCCSVATCNIINLWHLWHRSTVP